MTQKATIKEMIQEYRGSLKMSQEEFGVRYKVSRQTVSAWERGTFEAPYKVLEDVFGSVLGGQDE